MVLQDKQAAKLVKNPSLQDYPPIVKVQADNIVQLQLQTYTLNTNMCEYLDSKKRDELALSYLKKFSLLIFAKQQKSLGLSLTDIPIEVLKAIIPDQLFKERRVQLLAKGKSFQMNL